MNCSSDPDEVYVTGLHCNMWMAEKLSLSVQVAMKNNGLFNGNEVEIEINDYITFTNKEISNK